MSKKRNFLFKLSMLHLYTLPNCGVLWSGWSDARRVDRIAQNRGRDTLDMTLTKIGYSYDEIDRQIKQIVGDDWLKHRRPIWKGISESFAEKMSGSVDVYISESKFSEQTLTFPGGSEQKVKIFDDVGGQEGISSGSKGAVLLDEIMAMDFSGKVIGNSSVEGVQVTTFDDKDQPTWTYQMPISRTDH